MKTPCFLAATVFLIGFVAPLAGASADWPTWRGPTYDGHAATGQTVPVKWSETENVVWRAPVRGRGHSTPIVVGNHVYLTTADEVKQEQLVLCYDRASGKLLWETVAHRGPLDTIGHRNTSQASGSVAWDGERLYVNFLNAKAIHATALDSAGKILWQQRVSDYVPHQGFGSSPVVHESVVLIAADHKGGGKLVGLEKRTGKVLWELERPKVANYPSIAVLKVAGRTQAVLGGCGLILSFDPLTGKKFWEIEGSTDETVVMAVTDGQRVFVSGGYPKNNVTAVDASSGKIVWQNSVRVYVPSMMVRDGHLFAMLDAGHAVCWKADTGEEVWREKIDKDFYASPVLVGDRFYATSLRGVTSVFEATAQKFGKLLAQNQLGDEAIASPAICGNRIYLRSAKKGDTRQEYLWCIGEK
jgi:outer membrane protein assembly factor BamB